MIYIIWIVTIFFSFKLGVYIADRIYNNHHNDDDTKFYCDSDPDQ